MPSETRRGVGLFLVVLPTLIVYGEGRGDNLALKKPTQQSSVLGTSVSGYAVDGVKASDYRECAHTSGETVSWWLVDLQAFYYITRVSITNRGDNAFWDGLTNFTVDISREHPSALSGFPGNAQGSSTCVRVTAPIPNAQTSTFHCDEPLRGRYIRLVKITADLGYLVMSEFEAYGFKQWTFESVVAGSGTVEMVKSVPGTKSVLECTTECRYCQKASACRYFHYHPPAGICQLLHSNGRVDGDILCCGVYRFLLEF